MQLAREFRSLVRREDYETAREMMAPGARRWWEEREGEGAPWEIGPNRGPWAAWDAHFRSKGEVVEWTEESAWATVVVRESNDYYRLLERGSVTNEVTYFFDDRGRIEGLLIRGAGERPLGRTEEFLAWAREREPEELAALMPEGEIDPSGDHPARFRRLLESWREESGLGPIEPRERVVDLGPLIGPGTEATFVLLDLEVGDVVRHAPARASRPFLPASTFKIPNTLIALETGIVDGPDFAMQWDSVAVPREGFFPDSWARDQTLETAFRNSVVWFYEVIAREIGPAEYRKWLARFDYGNGEVDGGEAFWLDGDLRISADEQVEFLRRMWLGELGASERSTAIVKDLLLLEETGRYRLSGKTGTAEVTPTRELGWIVGVVETEGRAFAYALNMEGERVWEEWPPPRRGELVVALLERLGVIVE